MSNAIDIGPPYDSELNFIWSAWKRSARHTPKNDPKPSPKVFAELNRHVDRISALPGFQVLVARDFEDPAFTYGFIAFHVGEAFTVVWTYVRHGFRRQGIAKCLLAAALDYADDRPLLHFSETRFDAVADRYGFEYCPLVVWFQEVSK